MLNTLNTNYETINEYVPLTLTIAAGEKHLLTYYYYLITNGQVYVNWEAATPIFIWKKQAVHHDLYEGLFPKSKTEFARIFSMSRPTVDNHMAALNCFKEAQDFLPLNNINNSDDNYCALITKRVIYEFIILGLRDKIPYNKLNHYFRTYCYIHYFTMRFKDGLRRAQTDMSGDLKCDRRELRRDLKWLEDNNFIVKSSKHFFDSYHLSGLAAQYKVNKDSVPIFIAATEDYKECIF